MVGSAQRPVTWGICATGGIASSFAADLALVGDARLGAVASRTQRSADAFAEASVRELGHPERPRAHGSYEELAADPDVDVVYVATPHARHVADVMLFFEAGKAVLCEKALTLDAPSAAGLVAEARRRGVFFAEAMWMRVNPRVRHAMALVEQGACGEVRQVRADLGFVAPFDPAGRLWDPKLGASALLDVGIYPLTFAHLVLGEPNEVAATAVLSDRGIDVNGAAALRYASGAVASVAWTQTACSPDTASVAGDDGWIEVASRMHSPRWIAHHHDGAVDTYTDPVIGAGYAHEAIEVMRCLREGLTESPLLPLDDTVAVLATMDRIRELIGVRHDVSS